MRKIIFKIHICGMTERNYTNRIMIYKPHRTFKHLFKIKNLDDCKEMRISNFIEKFRKSNEYQLCDQNYYSMDELNLQSIYIEHRGTLYSFQSDKRIVDIFRFFKTNKIKIVYFFVAGGASIYCDGYKFVIHPNEEIHRNTPHVHVEFHDMSVRYYLDTLGRFPGDKYSREYKRDEKKIIIPGLKRNQKLLWQYWNCYMNGYIPPEIDERGKQYYKES